MKKKIKTIVIIFIVLVIIAVLLHITNTKDDSGYPKPEIKKKAYIIEEIVPEEIYSITPIYEDVQKENFTSGMRKVKEGMKEIGKSYRITNGETIIKFTLVAEEIVYVQKREIEKNCAMNNSTNSTNEPNN